MSPPLPTPGGQPGIGAFTVTCASRINASPETCLQVCRDTAKYAEWNAFVPWVTIASQPSGPSDPAEDAVLKVGTKFIFHANMNVGQTAPQPPPAKESLTATDELVVRRLGPVDEAVAEDRDANAVAERVFAEHGMAGAEGRKSRLRISWGFSGSKMPSWVLRSERVQEFHRVELGSGEVVTDYLCWETFGGLLSQVVKLSVGGKVQIGINTWGEGLKTAAEAMEGGKGAEPK